MAELQKDAALTAGSRKKVSSFDEDFGDDFFTSWKSTKVGKDTIDLDVDTVRTNEKKSFNFDKLDDFELGGGFDKISSFKVDMSDLDFSSPPKKADKPKEKCAKESGKQDLKQDKFSFTFDFNELDRFSLDSELLKGKNIASKCTDEDGPDNSINHDRDQDSRSNLATSTDSFQNAKTKRVADADSVATSRPTNSTDPGRVDGSCPSTSNLVNNDLSCEAMIPAEKQLSLVDEKNVDTNNTEVSREHSNGAGCKIPYAEKAEQHNLLQSLAGVGSEDDAPKLGKEFPLSDHLSAADSVKKQDSCMRSIDSSQSRNSSPVNSYNSRCVQEITKFKSLKINGDFPTNQQKQAEVIGCSTVHGELTQRQKDGGSASDSEFSQKNLDKLETSKDKKNPSPVILSPSLLRYSEGVKPVTVKEKPTPAVQLRSLNNSTSNVSRPTSLLASKELRFTQNRKIESMHPCPLNEKREPKIVEQSNDLKPDKSTTKGGPINLGKEKIARNIDSSRLHFQPLSVLNQAVAHSSEKGSTPNLISSTLSKRRSSVLSVERQKVSLTDDKRFGISSFTVSRLPKLNISTPKSPLHEEAKSSVLSEENLGFPISTKFTVANPVISEKTALTMSSPLKRKFEEMKEDLVAENPLKRVTDSPTERRKALEVSPNFNSKIIPSPEACHSNVHVVHMTSPSSDATGSMMNFEVPVLVENDGNVEKAEACAKELDNICNMLKRKHEEAKELLVRAIVNNNALLMLNHPMHDEKPCGSEIRCQLAIERILRGKKNLSSSPSQTAT